MGQTEPFVHFRWMQFMVRELHLSKWTQALRTVAGAWAAPAGDSAAGGCDHCHCGSLTDHTQPALSQQLPHLRGPLGRPFRLGRFQQEPQD